MNEKSSTEELSRYWQQQIHAWRASPLSQAAFCKTQHLSYHRFTYWKQKLTTSKTPPFDHQPKSGFARVCSETSEAGLSLSLPNGLVVRGFTESDLPLVCRLVEQLS